MGMRYTSMKDKEGDKLFEGDEVKFITGAKGEIVFECGAYGIGFRSAIDYEDIQDKMDALEVCCGNIFAGCFSDHFISLYEIHNNFNCDVNYLYPIEIISSAKAEEKQI